MKALFERLTSNEVLASFRGTNSVAAQKLLEELKTRLISANALLNDAEEKQLVNDDVGAWLGELKDIIYEADRVIDSMNTKAIRFEADQSKTLCISTPRFLSRSTLKAERYELEGIVNRLKLVIEQNIVLGLRPRGLDHTQTYYSHTPLVAPLAQEPYVYERESEREAIVESLISEDVAGPEISVIAIVGMGGIGKTTLAQLVYKDVRVVERFDMRVWVTVSDEFDVLKLTRAILDAVTSSKSHNENLFSLQNDLSTVLNGRRFLGVLDDVWNENYQLWDALKSPLESGARGSKIIITTRSLIVALRMGTHRTFDLKTMADDSCWSMFADHVLGNTVDDGSFPHKELYEIGIEIVKKCKGLPLAVKAIAGFLRSVYDPKKWRSVLESDLWDLKFQENQKSGILPALWLSYRNMSPQLKRCFAYCSIFPKDYEIIEEEKEKLVQLWMAEGLLKGVSGKTMEDVGREYLNELISRSLFQQSSRKYGEPILIMHDLVHDLATRVSGEFCFVSHYCDNIDNRTSKARHVSYSCRDENILKGLSLDSKRLRTMVALPLSYPSEITLLTWSPSFNGCLRALSLTSPSITKVPSSIANLKHLRYLNLSHTTIKEIPSSICTLCNLQTLLLEDCDELKKLPAETSSLINLRHLDIRQTSLRAMPPNMNKMTNLQTLTQFHLVEGSGSRIKELGDLSLLRGSLEITGIENIVDFNNVVEARLYDKEGIDELILQKWTHIDVERGILDAFRPHTALKKLKIWGFEYERLPNWIAHHSYANMTNITLDFCSCTILPPFGQLPSLKVLSLSSFSKLVCIGDEVCGDSYGESFPCLEKLRLWGMQSLEKWSFTSKTMIFPCLKSISVECCRKLNTGFPSYSLPALESAEFADCSTMVRLLDPIIQASYPSLKSSKVHCEGFDIKTCGALFTSNSNWDPSSIVFPHLEEFTLSTHSLEKWPFPSIS